MTEQTTHQPLTDQLLDEIETRAAHLYEYVSVTDEAAQPEADQLTGEDVPALVAEVRRLRTELADARRPDTPRLCECGHGHLAHTVPAPHSCFAFGQTCPCPAFRQLPHDRAVAQLEANRQAAAEREAARTAEETHVVADGSDDPEHIDDCPGCTPA